MLEMIWKIPAIVVIRVLGAALHALFLQGADAWNVLVHGECLLGVRPSGLPDITPLVRYPDARRARAS